MTVLKSLPPFGLWDISINKYGSVFNGHLTIKATPRKIEEKIDFGAMRMDSLNNMELHRALKQMRQNRKLKQAKSASEIGISTFTLIRWKRI